MIRPDGSEVRTILADPESLCVEGPAWSPDSQYIAFQSPCGDSPTMVWIIRADGTDRRLVFENERVPLIMRRLAWSPDGSAIAVALQTGADYLINVDCPTLPNGCDESSRTRIERIPEDWYPNYYPQWGRPPNGQ
jgi:Tol biopolymer transport system component